LWQPLRFDAGKGRASIALHRENPMGIVRRLTLSLLFVATLASASAFAETGETIRIGGTGGGLGLMRKLAALYTARHKGLTYTIVPSLGSTGGVRALRDGALDIAVSARPARAEEKGTESRFLAATPLAFVVHPGVGVSNITTAELEHIYGGSLTTWPDGKRMRLILRPETESDTKALRGISSAMNTAVTAAHSRPGMPMALNDQENLSMLKKTRGSLGIAALATLAVEHAGLKVLSFNGIRPGPSSLGDGGYPISRTFFLVIRNPASDAVRGFITFVTSPEARAMLKRYHCYSEGAP